MNEKAEFIKTLKEKLEKLEKHYNSLDDMIYGDGASDAILEVMNYINENE